jgi:hypothetical protein
MKTSGSSNKHGLSLAELMITIAIMTIIGGMLAYSLVIGGASWHTGDAEIQANQESRKGMMSMLRELRQAQEGNIRTMAGALYADDIIYNDINFIVISDIDGDGDTVSAGGTLEWSAPISYYAAGNQLLRQSNGAIKVLANNVTGVQFRILVVTDPINPMEESYRILTIALQTQKTSIEGRQMQSSLVSSVKIRN